MFDVSEGLTRWLYPELWWECHRQVIRKKSKNALEAEGKGILIN